MPPENIYEQLGRNLRDFRGRRGMTQANVAKVIGVSPQQYQKYEDAQSKCSLNNLMLLADFYGVPLRAILPMESGEDVPKDDELAIATEADLLARLVGAFVRLNDMPEKLRFVQLVEAINSAQERNSL